MEAILEMVVITIQLLFSVCLWGLQIGIFTMVVRGLIGVLPKTVIGAKRRLLSLVIAAAVLLSVVYLALNPVVICPEEYRPYAEEDMEWVGRGGLYSLQIPVFTVCKRVDYAGSRGVERVTTWYFPFGGTIYEYGDGISTVQDIFGRWYAS